MSAANKDYRPTFQPPDPGVTISRPGMMYASCMAYGCTNRFGQMIRLGGLEVRVCNEHVHELKKGLA
jgi:hypothetical protein